MTPSISFIVPIFQVQHYLHECIESLLAQSISKEIILIDDGSTDDSLSIALAYARQYPFITVVHSTNQGLSAARNKGICLARGEYLHFVDADDYLLGDYFNEIISVALQQSADLIRIQAELFYEGTQKCSPISSLSIGTSRDYHLFSAHQACHSTVEKGWLPGVCWTLVKKEYLLNNSLFFEEGVYAEDQLFYLQLLTKVPNARVLECPQTIYRYRRRLNSIVTTISLQRIYEQCHIIRQIHGYVKQSPLFVDNSFKSDIARIIEQLKQSAYQLAMQLPDEQWDIAFIMIVQELMPVLSEYGLST